MKAHLQRIKIDLMKQISNDNNLKGENLFIRRFS